VSGLEASPLALLIGLSLGAVGGGGSLLTIPVLVYVLGERSAQATTTSLLVTGLASVAGSVPHWRAGRVRIRSGLLFGLAGLGGAVGGSRLAEHVPQRVLLLAFAILMIVVAGAMLRRSTGTSSATDADGATGSMGSTVAKVAIAGTVVGLLTGFFGVGGGFVIVPALVFALGFSLPVAIGTSLIVVAMNSLFSLVARLDTWVVDWSVAVPFTLAALVGVVLGSAVASRVDERLLSRALALLLVVVALYVGTRAALSPSGAHS